MSDTPKRQRGLGRGLSSLMSDVVAQDPKSEPDTPRTRPDRTIPIDQISANPDQPRRHFDEGALAELAASIQAKGIIQPLIVRKTGEAAYQIVAGERRWRAAQKAGVHELPVVIRDLSDEEVLEFAIIENIQRDDLSAIDEAAGYKQLMDRFGHTQEAVATALGKSRSHIANLLRLLTLPASVQAFVNEGKISAGHARALIGHDDAEAIAQQIIKQGLSVRAVEALVRQPKPKPGKTVRAPAAGKDADTKQIEADLAAQLGVKVSIDHDAGKESGRVTLSYKDLGQLDDLLRVLSGG